MIEKRTAIEMRSRTLRNAKDVCQMCGRSTLLIVRTNQFFNYRRYLETGKIEQRELSAVCPSCEERMINRSDVNQNGFAVYCRIFPTGEVIEYR